VRSFSMWYLRDSLMYTAPSSVSSCMVSIWSVVNCSVSAIHLCISAGLGFCWFPVKMHLIVFCRTCGMLTVRLLRLDSKLARWSSVTTQPPSCLNSNWRLPAELRLSYVGINCVYNGELNECFIYWTYKATVTKVENKIVDYRETVECPHLIFWQWSQRRVHCHTAKPELNTAEGNSQPGPRLKLARQ
jgi:hypothetical protein